MRVGSTIFGARNYANKAAASSATPETTPKDPVTETAEKIEKLSVQEK